MPQENMNQEFRLKKKKNRLNKNFFNWKKNWNELMSKKYKEVCRVLSYIDHLLIVITGCVSISAFASLVGIPLGIMISAIGLKIFVIAAIKKYKSINKESLN